MPAGRVIDRALLGNCPEAGCAAYASARDPKGASRSSSEDICAILLLCRRHGRRAPHRIFLSNAPSSHGCGGGVAARSVRFGLICKSSTFEDVAEDHAQVPASRRRKSTPRHGGLDLSTVSTPSEQTHRGLASCGTLAMRSQRASTTRGRVNAELAISPAGREVRLFLRPVRSQIALGDAREGRARRQFLTRSAATTRARGLPRPFVRETVRQMRRGRERSRPGGESDRILLRAVR